MARAVLRAVGVAGGSVAGRADRVGGGRGWGRRVGAGMGGTSMVASVAYGGLCVVLPSAAMAWGMTSSALTRWLQRAAPGVARASLAGWLWWEGVKVLLTLAMLWSAPRWIPDLSWLGLVAGLVVVLKSYWLAWAVRPTARGRA